MNKLLAFYINVGSLPPDKAIEYLNKLKEENKSLLESRKLDSFWIAHRPPVVTRVESVSYKQSDILVFYVDIGNLPQNKADSYIDKIKEENAVWLSRLENEKVATIWMPVREGGSRIEVCPMPNVCATNYGFISNEEVRQWLKK